MEQVRIGNYRRMDALQFGYIHRADFMAYFSLEAKRHWYNFVAIV